MENLKNQLLADHSKASIDYIITVIQNDKECITKVFNWSINGEKTIKPRASYLFDSVLKKYPELTEYFISKIILKLNDQLHPGVKRDFLRIVARSSLPKIKLDDLLNNCFQWMQSSSETLSGKIHSMQIVYNISQLEPEIKYELISVIEDQMPRSSRGYKHRGTKLLKELYQEIKFINC